MKPGSFLLLAALVLGLAWAVSSLVRRGGLASAPPAGEGSEGAEGPCYFCGSPGKWCARCGVYKCARHSGLDYAVAGALTKALGMSSWHSAN